MNRRSFAQSVGSTAILSAVRGRSALMQASAVSTAGKVMAVTAHPGDGMFTMGAVLAKQVERGGASVLLSLSLGERGAPKDIPVQQYGSMQRTATDNATRLIGAETIFLDYPDAEVPFNEESSLRVSDAIRKQRPEGVVTHWSGSWHKDHQACHLIVRDAVFYAGLETLTREHPAHAVSSIFYAENWEDAVNFVPDTYIDIDSIYEKWMQACDCYPMWRGQTGFFRYNDYYSSLSVMRGCLSGSRHAVALMSDINQRTHRLQSL